MNKKHFLIVFSFLSVLVFAVCFCNLIWDASELFTANVSALCKPSITHKDNGGGLGSAGSPQTCYCSYIKADDYRYLQCENKDGGPCKCYKLHGYPEQDGKTGTCFYE